MTHDDQSLPNVPFNPARMNRIAANAVRAFVRVATTEMAIMSNFMAQIPDKQQHHPSRPSPKKKKVSHFRAKARAVMMGRNFIDGYSSHAPFP